MQRLFAELPSGLAIAEGKAVISEEQHIALGKAQAKRHEKLVELRDLKWWQEVDDPIKAEMALRKAARQAKRAFDLSRLRLMS
ncbi:hypothetical protein [Nonomuraea sp. SYSU D8015]|uniref:hypothetical protein n=1 Tax=Nonomuraea sp. SYSU D8015 TaxID=2593644 RepID=UPI0016605A79|nr:hypothetical protein [Nonomuraea sp. SYSU D8015]